MLASEQRRERPEEYQAAREMLPRLDGEGLPVMLPKPRFTQQQLDAMESELLLITQQGFVRGPRFSFPWASDWVLRCDTDAEHVGPQKDPSFCDGSWHLQLRKSKMTGAPQWWIYRACPMEEKEPKETH